MEKVKREIKKAPVIPTKCLLTKTITIVTEPQVLLKRLLALGIQNVVANLGLHKLFWVGRTFLSCVNVGVRKPRLSVLWIGKTFKFYITMAVFVISTLITVLSYSESNIFQWAGTSGALFMEIGVGAKPVSLGEAYVAGEGIADMNYWNPGAIAILDKPHATFTHIEWIVSTRLEHLSLTWPVGKYGAIGGNVDLMTYGEEPRTYEDEDKLFLKEEGTFWGRDLLLTVNYAHEISNYKIGSLCIGGGLSYLNSEYDKVMAHSVAMNVGVFYRPLIENLSAGLVLKNIGTKLKYIKGEAQLPFNGRLGLSYKFFEGLAVGYFAVKIPIYQYPSFHFGLEYNPWDFVSFRVGYKYTWGGNPLGWYNDITSGVGFRIKDEYLRWGDLMFDYAFVPFGDLGFTHRISIEVGIGNKKRNNAEDK